MRKVTFHEDAETEMKEAARYYEERALGLGMSFLYAVEEAVEQALANPEAYQLVGDDVLVEAVDEVIKELKTNRFSFTRNALRNVIAQYKIRCLEEQPRRGYQQNSVQRDEFSVW